MRSYFSKKDPICKKNCCTNTSLCPYGGLNCYVEHPPNSFSSSFILRNISEIFNLELIYWLYLKNDHTLLSHTINMSRTSYVAMTSQEIISEDSYFNFPRHVFEVLHIISMHPAPPPNVTRSDQVDAKRKLRKSIVSLSLAC